MSKSRSSTTAYSPHYVKVEGSPTFWYITEDNTKIEVVAAHAVDQTLPVHAVIQEELDAIPLFELQPVWERSEANEEAA